MAVSKFLCFDADGHVCGGGQRFLPDWLDWHPLDEIEIWYMHMGGFPPSTERVLIEAQGARKLVVATDASREHVDYNLHRRRENASKAEVERICAERGIDCSRKPRNQ